MLEINQIYVCEKCGLKVRQVSDTDETPQHCKLPMKETDADQPIRRQYIRQISR